MQRPATSRLNVLYVVATWAGWPLLTLYGFCMFAYPWLKGDWKQVQEVWDRWQTLNAGALAFAASLIAFSIAKFNEGSQRAREFTAAKAFLPSSLSGLFDYFKESAKMLTKIWRLDGDPIDGLQAPPLPKDYREVFSNCIRHADPEVGSYLSGILVRLQVHDARLRDAVAEAESGERHSIDKDNLIAYLFCLGELYSLVGNLFDFARSEKDFSDRALTPDDFYSAYRLLDLDAGDFDIDEARNLLAFTKRGFERRRGKADADI